MKIMKMSILALAVLLLGVHISGCSIPGTSGHGRYKTELLSSLAAIENDINTNSSEEGEIRRETLCRCFILKELSSDFDKDPLPRKPPDV